MTQEELRKRFEEIDTGEPYEDQIDNIMQLINQHVAEEKEKAIQSERERITQWFKDTKEELAGKGFILTLDERGNLIAKPEEEL